VAVGFAHVVVNELGVNVIDGTIVFVGTLTVYIPIHPFVLSVIVTT
jgi:hypothetical protein